MKYVIANCGFANTNVFIFETESPAELFRFVKMNNDLLEGDAPEIEVYEYSALPEDGRVLELANIIGRIPSLNDLFYHDMYGAPVLSRDIDNTDKINVLLEE